MNEKDDEDYMDRALRQAEAAAEAGEVPVGCVIVLEDRLMGCAHNMRETLGDPTAHAEILALTQAAEKAGSWRLEGTVVYCNLEPCCMCAGALVNARVGRLVYGLADPKSGACGSVYDIPTDGRLNHTLKVTGGVLEDRSRRLLRKFFQSRRGSQRGPTGDG